MNARKLGASGLTFNRIQRFTRQFRHLWKVEGPKGIVKRARSKLATLLASSDMPLEVLKQDVLASDISRDRPHAVLSVATDEPIRLNWVVTPAAPGSGGHTTLYRIINFLERHGYRSQVYFYDVYSGDHAYYANVVRTYYRFEGPVKNVNNGMEDAHGVFATAWQTAYPAMNSQCAGKRFYLVQDYEPYFYPIGSNSVLAENTYRMGFYGVTAGRWLAMKLRDEFQMSTEYFSFGCDTQVYKRDSTCKRDGIAFYSRPGAARRATELGLLAVEEFARRRPDLKIHLYGEKMGKLSFAFVDHGAVTPSDLNSIYNRCCAGLSLSMTNVSLVPHEMLAAGCIPVVNEGAQNRIVLDNEYVRYASPNPLALASELEAAVSIPEFDSYSIAAAGSIRSLTWEDAGRQVDTALRKALFERD